MYMLSSSSMLQVPSGKRAGQDRRSQGWCGALVDAVPAYAAPRSAALANAAACRAMCISTALWARSCTCGDRLEPPPRLARGAGSARWPSRCQWLLLAGTGFPVPPSPGVLPPALLAACSAAGGVSLATPSLAPLGPPEGVFSWPAEQGGQQWRMGVPHFSGKESGRYYPGRCTASLQALL